MHGSRDTGKGKGNLSIRLTPLACSVPAGIGQAGKMEEENGNTTPKNSKYPSVGCQRPI